MTTRLLIGLDFIDDTPCVRLDIGGNWVTLPEGNARVAVGQILTIIDAITAPQKRDREIPYLIRCEEYGPFIAPERRS